MIKKLIAVFLSVLIVSPAQVRAASADECAIWLCLPIGFAHPACAASYSAMLKRLLEFKGPAPSFNSCEVENSTDPNRYTIGSGTAILMAGPNLGQGKIRDGGFCNHRDSGGEEPAGCATTLRMYWLLENGVQMGETVYRDTERGKMYRRDEVTGYIHTIRDFTDELEE